MSNLNNVHFKFLPMSMRVLFSSVLLVFGLAYCMAMVQVWESHAGKDGDPMLSGKDLMIAYGGNPNGTKLETALRGPMQDMLPKEKRQVIFDWLHNGAKADEIEAKITPILQEHCVACHNPEANPHLPNFTSPDGLKSVAAKDEGMTIPTLVRVSHIHLFSITFIFFIVGFIFTHAVVRPTWLKCVVLATPFLSLITDVASWYLTKVWDGFAWMVIISGAFMGTAFTIMWFTSMYQMWIGKVPASVDEDGKVPCIR
ncbi:MAG: elongation factor-1 alpha [Gallionellaceae bacterium]|nr:elongation factor-1 alpha [Gallionellaceae bacterium]